MDALINRGHTLLNRAMTPAAATTVLYRRASTVISEALPAALSAQQVVAVTEGGASVVGRQFTWKVKRSDLIWEGVEDRPRRSDRIDWVHEGKSYAFEVLPASGGAEMSAVDPRSGWIPTNAKLIEVTNE